MPNATKRYQPPRGARLECHVGGSALVGHLGAELCARRSCPNLGNPAEHKVKSRYEGAWPGVRPETWRGVCETCHCHWVGPSRLELAAAELDMREHRKGGSM